MAETTPKKNYEILLAEGTKELTIREGPALDPKYLAAPSINITGSLQAPFNFLSGKPSMAEEPEKMHMMIDLEKGELTLIIKDDNPHTKHTISGKLTKYAALADFRINTDKRWAPREFTKFIRTAKVYFADRKEVDDLIQSFTVWQAKVETVIKDHNDNAGNSLTMLEKKVSDVNLKTKFDLLIPIYKGYKNVKFTVEIGLEPKNSGVELFLVSDELYEQEILQKQTIMADELSKFDDNKFSKVVIS